MTYLLLNIEHPGMTSLFYINFSHWAVGWKPLRIPLLMCKYWSVPCFQWLGNFVCMYNCWLLENNFILRKPNLGTKTHTLYYLFYDANTHALLINPHEPKHKLLLPFIAQSTLLSPVWKLEGMKLERFLW